MRGVVLHPSGQVQVVDLPEPPLTSPTQVRVQVVQGGVGQRDRDLLHRARPGPALWVLGHEVVGRVVERGGGVRHLRLGDTVVATVRRGCGACESCRVGRPDQCYTGLYTERGLKGAPGLLTEFFVEEAEHLVPLPSALRAVGVLAEPLSHLVKALEVVREMLGNTAPRCGHPDHRWGGPQPGWCKRVLVHGDGPLAALGASLLRALGADTLVYSPAPPSSPLASWVGQTGAQFLSRSEVPPGRLGDWTGEVDLVLEVGGDAGVVGWAPRLLARNGLLLLLGRDRDRTGERVEGGTFLSVLRGGGRAVVGCEGTARRHMEAAVEALGRLQRSFPGLLPRLLTHRYPLDQAPEAFARSGPDVLKVVVEF